MILLLAALGLTGCAAPPRIASLPTWRYADVRLIDPVDASQPGQDLIAAYAQETSETLDVRLDLLDASPAPNCDLYIAIDYTPGGRSDLPLDAQAQIEWDTLIVIPASADLQVLGPDFQPQPDAALRVLRDPVQDNLALRVRLPALSGRQAAALQIFSAAPHSPVVTDQTAPFGLHAAPPSPAPVVLAFWDAYPAYTPATALRRWSGAHTGPLGGSHGLSLLLQAAEDAHIPLALLDLKDPAGLSALDYAAGLPQVQRMAQAGLLILPESLPDLPPGLVSRELIRQSPALDGRFGLRESPFIFAPDRLLPFGKTESRALARWSGPLRMVAGTAGPAQTGLPQLRGLPLRVIWPGVDAAPASAAPAPPALAMPDGLTLEARQALVEAGIAAGQPPGQGAAAPLLFGGRLPQSEWGAPLLARQGFAYFNAHPWIRVFGRPELAALVRAEIAPRAGFLQPKQGRSGDELTSLAPQAAEKNGGMAEALEAALSQAPDNELRLAAWQAYQALFTPVYPTSEKLPALRANYTGQVWSLLAAAQWAALPQNAPTHGASPVWWLDCAHDPDRDGRAECILADESLYLQFEAESGALTFAFRRSAGPGGRPAVHQWIGPSSQMISGLSDPATWKLDGGLSADPQVLPGAFFEPGLIYTPARLPNGLAFRTANGQVEKRFTWNGDTLQVDYVLAGAPSVAGLRLPLLLDPWERFAPGWYKRYAAGPKAGAQIAWRLDAAIEVQLEAPGLRLDTFLDSLALFRRPENPDIDYPAGHYLPFPLAVATLPLHSGVNRLTIRVEP